MINMVIDLLLGFGISAAVAVVILIWVEWWQARRELFKFYRKKYGGHNEPGSD